MSAIVKRSNPHGVTGLLDKMKLKTKKEVAVGFPAGLAQAYPDGTAVAAVAARHVYGVGVPKRDFMGLARDGIVAKTAPIIKAALSVDDPEPLMEAAGQAAQAEIQKAIVDLDDPPNSPETIAAKESDNPLIDTGHMNSAVTYIVRDRTR